MSDFNNNKNVFTKTISKIAELIKGSVYEGSVYLVGDGVRDVLLGKELNDIDLVVNMPNGGIKLAEWICKHTDCYKASSNPIVTQYGTAKFKLLSISDIANVEIKIAQTSNQSYTDSTSKNTETYYGTISQDCLRRDLTINALYYNISGDSIIDPCGKGRNDLKNCIIRTTSDPNIVFKDNALKLLRVIRFATKLNWGIDKDTWIGILNNAHRINTISQERITEELTNILTCENASLGIERLKKSGLLLYLLPEVHKLIGVTQNMYHFGDVYEHTLAVVDKVKPIGNYRWAALLHDIGKPSTKTGINDAIHFYNHESLGKNIAIEILKRFKFSNADTSAIVCAVANHMKFKDNRITPPSYKTIKKFVNETQEHLDICLDLIDADNNSHAQKFCLTNQVYNIRKRINELVEEEKKLSNKIVLPINGKDIMEKFHLKSSPKIGELLDIVKELYKDNPLVTKEQCFSALATELKLIA